MELIQPLVISHNKLKDKNLKRAHYVLEQAEKQNIALTDEDDDYWKVCRALATLGEPGRDIFSRLVALSPVVRTAIEADFDKESATPKYKTPAKLFEVAINYGLVTKLPMGLRESKEKIAARDFLGSNTDEWLRYKVWEEDGLYWGADERTYKPYEIANFTMAILWFVKTGDKTAYRLIEMQNVHGVKRTVNVNTDDFVGLGTFKKIVEREGNFLFKGTDIDLIRLKDKLQREERMSDIVKQLGWNKTPGFYAFANGVYDAATDAFIQADSHGIVEFNGKNYFIPANAEMFADKEDLFSNDKKFFWEPLSVTFEDWSNQFVLVYGKEGITVMVFYMMSLFSDIIFNELNHFPLMAVCGKRGSGKGALINSVMRLFGTSQSRIMLGTANTIKGMMRKFSQYCNAMMWVDEYKNNLGTMVVESLKNLSDRESYTRSKIDSTFETETMPVRSGCLLSGQEIPTGESGLFTRVILAIKMVTSYTESERENFRNLKEMQKKGLSGITTMLLKYRPFFNENFKTVFDAEQKKLIAAVNNNEIDERMYVNYGAMIATAELISSKLNLPFNMVTFKEHCKAGLLQQFFMLKGSDDAGKFWDVVETLFNQGLIKNERHFVMANGLLYIRIQDIHQDYAEALLRRKDNTGLDKETLYKYLESDSITFVAKKKKTFGGGHRWCHIFKYANLGIDLIRADNNDELAAKYKEMNLKMDTEEDL